MRNVRVEVERDRIRLRMAWGEDEFVSRLKLDEAEDLSEALDEALDDYRRRKRTRVD